MFSTISKNDFILNEIEHNSNCSYNNDRRYQQLITNINHEMKTPLASLRLIAEGIEDGVFPVDKKICADIIEQVNRLDDTLKAIKMNNDLHYRQQEFLLGGESNEASCDAEQVLSSVCEEFESPMMKKGIVVKYVDNVKSGNNSNLELASEDLRASFSNILQNVLDHAVGATEARVTCDTVDYRGKKFFAVTFADNGCGTEASQDDMLSPFWCGDESHTSAMDNGKHNIGMGLAYVNDVVRSVEGSIRIDSSTGAGMTITIIFPTIQNDMRNDTQNKNAFEMHETFCFA